MAVVAAISRYRGLVSFVAKSGKAFGGLDIMRFVRKIKHDFEERVLEDLRHDEEEDDEQLQLRRQLVNISR